MLIKSSQDWEKQLNRISFAENQLQAIKASCEVAIPDIEKKIEGIENTLTLIGESREYWRKAIDLAYKRSVGELNKKLNIAIKYIYFDRDFSVELVLEDKRGKSLQIILKDEEGNDISVKDGCGMGIRTIISSILQIYYLNSKDSHILFIDEKYSYLSEAYLPRFFEFINKMCEKSGFTLVLITHDPRLFEYANTKIRVVNGEVINEQ